MKLEDKMLDILNKSLAELQKYTEVYNLQDKVKKEEYITKNLAKFKDNPESVDLQDVAKNLYYMNGFHQLDIRRLQTHFLSSYIIYKELEISVPVGEDVEVVANLLKKGLGSQMFTVEHDKFREIIAGSTGAALQKYEDNNYYRLFESELSKLFNGQSN